MKKLFAVVLAVAMLLTSSLAFAETPGNRESPGVGDILGQGKFPSAAHKIFRLVRYVPASGSDNSITLTADSIVIWDTTSDDGVTVTTTTTSSDGAVAGIIATTALTPELGALGSTAAVDIGRRNWTWLQTYGPATAMMATGADGRLALKSAFGTSTSTGYISAWTPDAINLLQSGAGVATVVNWTGIAGFALDDATTSTSGQELVVFLKGLD